MKSSVMFTVLVLVLASRSEGGIFSNYEVRCTLCSLDIVASAESFDTSRTCPIVQKPVFLARYARGTFAKT